MSVQMTDEEFLKIPIRELLPQCDPFVMVSQLLHYDEVVTRTRFYVSADNIFCQRGVFSPCGMVENIAQTCAARIGYINKYILHRDIDIGFIGAIRSLTFHALPEVGETIETSIEILSSAFGMSLAKAEIRDAMGHLLADGEMKISLKEA